MKINIDQVHKEIEETIQAWWMPFIIKDCEELGPDRRLRDQEIAWLNELVRLAKVGQLNDRT